MSLSVRYAHIREDAPSLTLSILFALVLTILAACQPAHAATKITLGGKTLQCDRLFGRGMAEIQIDNSMASEGGAAPGAGVLVMNQKMLGKLEPVVRWWIFSHECGHLVYKGGGTELQADTYAVKLGIKQGWLTPEYFKAICDSWEDAPAIGEHPSGRTRCANLKARYAEYAPLYSKPVPEMEKPTPPPVVVAKRPEPAWRQWSLLAWMGWL
jgi:hypothetical protein